MAEASAKSCGNQVRRRQRSSRVGHATDQSRVVESDRSRWGHRPSRVGHATDQSRVAQRAEIELTEMVR